MIDETRAKLLEAAGLEFAQKGFEGATVRAICDRAGVNLAAVNYHFGDKVRLYEAVLMLAHQSRPAFVFNPADREEDPRESFRRFLAHFLEEVVFQSETPWHQEVMFREISAPTKASDRLVREAFRPRFEALTAILRRLTPGSDERQIHAIGFSVVGQCLHYKISRPTSERIIGPEAFGRLDAAYLVEHITRFTLAAVGQGEPLTKPIRTEVDAPNQKPTERG